MTLREAVANLIKVKGRHNTEIAYQKLVEAFDADRPDVCCQDFEKCVRSCTPRGQWIAHVRCGCGDQIMPNDGAECGNCVAARNAVKPEWVGLTDEQKKMAYALYGTMTAEGFVKSLETKLREKNT